MLARIPSMTDQASLVIRRAHRSLRATNPMVRHTHTIIHIFSPTRARSPVLFAARRTRLVLRGRDENDEIHASTMRMSGRTAEREKMSTHGNRSCALAGADPHIVAPPHIYLRMEKTPYKMPSVMRIRSTINAGALTNDGLKPPRQM